MSSDSTQKTYNEKKPTYRRCSAATLDGVNTDYEYCSSCWGNMKWES